MTEGLTDEQKKRLAQMGDAERVTMIFMVAEIAAEKAEIKAKMLRYEEALRTIARMDRAPVAQAHARAALNPEETL